LCYYLLLWYYYFKISDYNGKILALNSAHGGKTHDARVWNVSIISHLEQQYNNGRRNCWLLGMSNIVYLFSFTFCNICSMVFEN